MDVVPEVVSQNQLAYGNPGPEGSASMVQFSVLDLTTDAFPETRPGDLIICRHLMFHLPSHHNQLILSKLASSDASYLMLTTYLRADDNERDFVFAMGHLVNLFRSPYCVKDPHVLLRDDDHDLYVGLWKLEAGENSITGGPCLN
jgi:hypothetical protein